MHRLSIGIRVGTATTTMNSPELNGYYALNAQDMYDRRRAVHRKMVLHPQVMAAVRAGLDAGWSPEQIAGRMRLECHRVRVSHETIYRFAYSKDGLAEQFYRHLPEMIRRILEERLSQNETGGK